MTPPAGPEPVDDPRERVLSREEAVRRYGRPRDHRLVFTNGVFDLLHRGHAAYLAAARALGDRLLVAVNSDASAARIKGPGRPVQSAEDRTYLLASLRCVDAVTVFQEDTPETLVRAVLPDVLVKGADYARDEVVGAGIVEEAGGTVRLLPLVEGRSTSTIVERIRGAAGPERPPESERSPEPRLSGERILVATRSRHKMREIRDLLRGLAVQAVSLAELGVDERPEEARIERYETFAENALAKARYFHDVSGLFAVADDSGLCVDALGGGPGIRTKHLAPERMVDELGRDAANNRRLLDLLAAVPEEERTARYRCAVAAYDGRGSRVWEGKVEGRIAGEPRGSGGFGYDPLFVVPAHGRTFGELPPEAKGSLSHRARAFGAFRRWLEAAGGGGAAAEGGGGDRPTEEDEA